MILIEFLIITRLYQWLLFARLTY